MDAHERRITNLEKTIPTVHRGGFRASIRPADPPLGDDDPRLRSGVEEFEYMFPPGATKYPGKEKRGRGFISPWCMVECWDGGDRKAWNRTLKDLRQDDTFFDGHGVSSTLIFGMDGTLQPGGILFRLFLKLDADPQHSRWWRPPQDQETGGG